MTIFSHLKQGKHQSGLIGLKTGKNQFTSWYLYFKGGRMLHFQRKGGKRLLFLILGWKKARVEESEGWEKISAPIFP